MSISSHRCARHPYPVADAGGRYIYYHRVRLFMTGWKDARLPDAGVYYEGVDQHFSLYGETGAQSTLIPALDACLGITSSAGAEGGSLVPYLLEVRAIISARPFAMRQSHCSRC